MLQQFLKSANVYTDSFQYGDSRVHSTRLYIKLKYKVIYFGTYEEAAVKKQEILNQYPFPLQALLLGFHRLLNLINFLLLKLLHFLYLNSLALRNRRCNFLDHLQQCRCKVLLLCIHNNFKIIVLKIIKVLCGLWTKEFHSTINVT